MVYRYLKRAARKILKRKKYTLTEKNAIEIERISQSGERVVFISSYPRSGNTWLRYIFSDHFIQKMGFNTTTQLPVHPDMIIPDRYFNTIADRDRSIPSPGLFVKTHDDFDTASGLVAANSCENSRHVYIYLCPEDALVSYYHFHRRYKHLIPQTTGGIDVFCLERVDDCCSHVDSYVKAKQKHGDCVFFVPCEHMLTNPETILNSVFAWLDTQIEEGVLQHAISNMQFSNLSKVEAQKPINDEEYFFRNGTSGNGRQELQVSTVNDISMKTSKLLRQISPILAEQ